MHEKEIKNKQIRAEPSRESRRRMLISFKVCIL